MLPHPALDYFGRGVANKDILIFIFSIVIGEWIAYKIMKKTAADPQVTPISCSPVSPFRLVMYMIKFVGIYIGE